MAKTKSKRKRGKDGKFVPKKESNPNVDAVTEILQEMNKSMKEFANRVDKIENRLGPQTATEQVNKIIGDDKPKEELEDETMPEIKIHPKHRAIVNDILGEQFKAWESYEGTNSTHFLFHIKVPQELSSIPVDDQNKGRDLDIRTKAISNAEGENGVREWCQKVRNNLNKYYSNNAIPSPFNKA